MKKTIFPAEGHLSAGCNYWASHAGIRMWQKWDETTVDKDLAAIASHGMDTLRVFPLWPDFQPVNILRTCSGVMRQYCGKNEKLLSPDEDGMDEEMLLRFASLADLAEKHHLKLIVGLLTGWMSGRLFVPEALEGRNLFTDPEALRWEGRFLHTFVRRFKDHPAIAAWEPGNECNCLSPLPSGDFGSASYHWMDFVTSAIRAEDPVHPVYSGMHGCPAEAEKQWNLHMLGELCDGTTTHPYPLFTPHCGKSPLNTLPAVLHSTAETLFYRGISGKPAFVEEIGTLGECFLSRERTASYLRTALLSAWVHDCREVCWWCAFDQDHLEFSPYCWEGVERELGLFRQDKSPHPAALEVKKTMEFLHSLPFEKLPKRKADAVVLPVSRQEKWKSSYGAFLLAKQAGAEIEFHSAAKEELPDAPLYYLPALDNGSTVSFSLYSRLVEKVKEGACLLVTDGGNAVVHHFEKVFGCRIEYTALVPREIRFRDGENGETSTTAPVTRKLVPVTAKILLADEEGEVLLSVNELGKGKVFFLACAPEMTVLDEKKPQWYRIYRKIFREAGLLLPEKLPQIGRTLHEFPDGKSAVIELNYSDAPADGIPPNGMRMNFAGKETIFPSKA